MDEDVRWIQRLSNYRKALRKLEEGLNQLSGLQSNYLLDIVREGVIQRFEFTHELAWKVMKDYLEYQGVKVMGSRDAIRNALNHNLISDKVWLKSVDARNLTSHTYDEEIADEVFESITNIYLPLFQEFMIRMEEIEHESES
ncbi:MAG: nucleotidyltransferase substrate binding protein [Muribaculaceae bacterium]|nr:nucleotidyltransferase substrate binding protein [Muribaculaceae bacterium]